MSFDPPEMKLPTAPNAPPPPVLASSPQGQKPKKKSSQPSFLGTEATPGEGQTGQKTLLGQ